MCKLNFITIFLFSQSLTQYFTSSMSNLVTNMFNPNTARPGEAPAEAPAPGFDSILNS